MVTHHTPHVSGFFGLTRMITETRMVVMHTTRGVRACMDNYQVNPVYFCKELAIGVAAALADDPVGYLTDVHAQRNLSPDQLEEAIESSLSVCDVLFHDYHGYLQPLREEAESGKMTFAVRDLSYNHQQWGFILQCIVP